MDASSRFLSRVPVEVRVVLRELIARPARGPVVFDADGTLWRGDVGEDFLRYLTANGLLEVPCRPGLFGEYERRVADAPAEAYAFAVEVMEGMDEGRLSALCATFFRERFYGRLFWFTRPLVTLLREEGFSAWIVSASPRWIVAAGAAALGLPVEHVVGVSCEVEAGRLTARVNRPVPCGEGKVEHLRQRGVRPLLAIGNGDLDLPMLEFSERAMVVAPFDDPGNSLVAAALVRGWPVLRG